MMKASAFASLIGTTPRTVYTLIKQNEVATVYQGKKRMVDVDASKDRLAKAGKLDEHGKYLPRASRGKKGDDGEQRSRGLSFDGEIETTSSLPNAKICYAQESNVSSSAEGKTKDLTRGDTNAGTYTDTDLLMNDIPDDLAEILEYVHNPKDKTQVINNYWVGKKNRQAYEREKRELIPMSEAKAVMDTVLVEISEKMSNMPTDIKNRFPSISDELYRHIEWYIDHIKSAMQEIPWES